MVMKDWVEGDGSAEEAISSASRDARLSNYSAPGAACSKPQSKH